MTDKTTEPKPPKAPEPPKAVEPAKAVEPNKPLSAPELVAKLQAEGVNASLTAGGFVRVDN